MLVESDLGAGVRKAVAEVDRRDRVRTAGENFIASLLSFISCYDAIGCCGWSAVQLKGNVDKIDISLHRTVVGLHVKSCVFDNV